jgi:23S rRNA (cytidine2498-2'-O)-methyltransferase
MEALNHFGVDLSPFQTALDLGASPGGFTRVLARSGLSVWAVDPGALDERALLPNVRHFSLTAGRFLEENPSLTFDVICNDMKMDAALSIEIMESASKRLNPGGVMIMTIKLPHSEPCKQVKAAVKKMERRFEVAGVKALWHNRREVTAVLRGKAHSR